MNNSTKLFSAGQLCLRNSAVRGKASAMFARLKENQKKFQIDDGLPVFLKGGARDKMMYQATWILIGIGSGMMLKLFYDLAKPK